MLGPIVVPAVHAAENKGAVERGRAELCPHLHAACKSTANAPYADGVALGLPIQTPSSRHGTQLPNLAPTVRASACRGVRVTWRVVCSHHTVTCH